MRKLQRHYKLVLQQRTKADIERNVFEYMEYQRLKHARHVDAESKRAEEMRKAQRKTKRRIQTTEDLVSLTTVRTMIDRRHQSSSPANHHQAWICFA